MTLPLATPAAAAAVLRAGGLVLLPTETVYGLAADAVNRQAVARVYAAKGRPADHPLILHVASAADLGRWTRDVPDYALRLAQAAWPGPLTLVLPRGALVGDHITGGQPSVAIRVPDHPAALSVLTDFGSAVAAPSANRFGHVSPTAVDHALADLGESLDPARDVALDGGQCRVGVESTIVDCTGARPCLLRPGWYGPEQIEELGGVSVAAADREPPRVPGSTASHYAPRARVRLATASEVAAQHSHDPGGSAPSTGLLALARVPLPGGWVRLAAPETPQQFAQVLYLALREADALGLEHVVAVAPEAGDGVATAILDRLTRASAGS